MKPIQIISQDLFDKIRSRFSDLEMGTEDGGVTIDPSEARFFDFNFIFEESNLGRVSISINDPGSLKIYYSQGITEDQDPLVKKYWYKFLKEMRYFAMRRLLRFDTRDISKENLDKNDFQFLASTKPKEEQAMNMNESRWTGRNTSKTSRRVQGRTQVIVRHKQKVNEMLPADRSKPSNITAIFIQNSDGERFKSPFNYLPLAFALAQHIDHGGVPYDAPAKKIIGMCERIAQLNEFRKHIKTSKLHGDTLGIVDKAVGRLNELKSTLDALGKRRNYESWLAEFNEQEQIEDDLIELSPVQVEEYKAKFTQNEFNENLMKYFPLIHSIMQEKIELDEYVNTEEKVDEIGPIALALARGAGSALATRAIDSLTKDRDSEKEGFENFEQWAESIEQGKLDRSSIEKNIDKNLIEKLSEIPLGAGGATAWAELKDIFEFDERDEDDKNLKDQLEEKSETADNEQTGLDSPTMDVFKSWIKDVVPKWKEDLPELFPENQPQTQMTPEPETGMQPVTAPQPGVNPNPTPGPETGMNPAVKPGQPVAEDKSKSMMQEIAETVKRFYNASNKKVGPFRSEEAVCLEVEKTIKEKYGEEAGKRAGMIAKQFIEKLTRQWEIKHHKRKEELAPVEDDGLSRLKELLGNVKAKVESMSTKDVADEGILDKVKQFGKTVLDKVAPDDATLLKDLEKDSGGRIPPQFEPKPEVKSESIEDILKLSGLKK